MKTNRTADLKLRPLTTVLSLVAIATALLVSDPSRAVSGKPYVNDIDWEWLDTESYCVPVHGQVTGRFIFQPGDDGYPVYTDIQQLKFEWTNLNTGKTVSAETAVRLTDSYLGDFGLVDVLTGVVLIHQGNGVWLDAGMTVTIVYDPVTGEYLNLTVRDDGTHPVSYNDALCAALQ